MIKLGRLLLIAIMSCMIASSCSDDKDVKIIPIDAKEDSWHILIEVDKGTFPLDCKFSIDLKEMSDYSFYKKHTDANNSGCSQIAGVYFHYFQ